MIPHFDERAQMLGAFVLITDITRHQLAEQAIRDSAGAHAQIRRRDQRGNLLHKDSVLTDVNESLLAIMATRARK